MLYAVNHKSFYKRDTLSIECTDLVNQVIKIIITINMYKKTSL